IYPFESCDGSKGYLSCRRKPSKEEITSIQEVYKLWNKEEGK
ncbi:PAS sensor domain-containing protein, partial [Halarcobacter ebronensis]